MMVKVLNSLNKLVQTEFFCANEIRKIHLKRFDSNTDHNRPSTTFIQIGDSTKIERTFTIEDVLNFAKLTNDFNPIHLEESAAKKRGFPKPIVHGALINGVISSVIGTILPGNGSILLEQDLHFPNPLFVEEQFTAKVDIVNRKRNIYFCQYECITIDGKKVMEGMAKIVFRP